MEIKHIHPQHPSEESRLEQLMSVRRACAALLGTRRQEKARRRTKDA